MMLQQLSQRGCLDSGSADGATADADDYQFSEYLRTWWADRDLKWDRSQILEGGHDPMAGTDIFLSEVLGSDTR